jgi:type II secretory pathway pseudopilin PulG
VKRWRAGLSLAETTVALAVVTVLLAAALNTVGAAVTTQALAADQERGAALAHDLMVEIMQAAYGDVGESFSPTEEKDDDDRLDYDEIDDYHGWRHTPPVERDGTVIDWGWGLSRRVMISNGPSGGGDLFQAAGESKVIRVEVLRGGRLVCALEAVRAADSGVWLRSEP